MAYEAFKQKVGAPKEEEISKIMLAVPKFKLSAMLTLGGINETANSFRAAVMGEPIPGTKNLYAEWLPKYGGHKFEYENLLKNFTFSLETFEKKQKS